MGRWGSWEKSRHKGQVLSHSMMESCTQRSGQSHHLFRVWAAVSLRWDWVAGPGCALGLWELAGRAWPESRRGARLLVGRRLRSACIHLWAQVCTCVDVGAVQRWITPPGYSFLFLWVVISVCIKTKKKLYQYWWIFVWPFKKIFFILHYLVIELSHVQLALTTSLKSDCYLFVSLNTKAFQLLFLKMYLWTELNMQLALKMGRDVL